MVLSDLVSSWFQWELPGVTYGFSHQMYSLLSLTAATRNCSKSNHAIMYSSSEQHLFLWSRAMWVLAKTARKGKTPLHFLPSLLQHWVTPLLSPAGLQPTALSSHGNLPCPRFSYPCSSGRLGLSVVQRETEEWETLLISSKSTFLIFTLHFVAGLIRGWRQMVHCQAPISLVPLSP